MIENLILLMVVIDGVALGVIFFGGLWWTVLRGVSSPRPALWFFVSLLLRTGIVLGGFYFVGHGSWERLVACLLGFVMARFVVMRLTRRPIEKCSSLTEEARHAP